MNTKFKLKSIDSCSCNSDCDCSRYPEYVLLRNGKRGYGSGGYGQDMRGKDVFSGSFMGLQLSGATVTEVAQKLQRAINMARDDGDEITVEIE